MTEATLTKVAEATLVILEAREPDYDRDEFMRYINSFYDEMAADGMDLVEPETVTEEWCKVLPKSSSPGSILGGGGPSSTDTSLLTRQRLRAS